jgi:hypothetical protein
MVRRPEVSPAHPLSKIRGPTSLLRMNQRHRELGLESRCAVMTTPLRWDTPLTGWTVWPQIAAIHSQDFPTTTERESADEDLTDCLFAFSHSQNENLVTSAERDVASGEDDLAVTHYRNDRGLSRKTEVRDRDAVGR